MVFINITAVLAAAVVQMFLGFLWYGPFFGKTWMRLTGVSKDKISESKKKGMKKIYLVAFLSSLVMAYVVANFVFFLNTQGVLEAMRLGFWIWLGFVATVMLGQVLWLDKSLKLYALDTGYYLLTLILTSIIVTVWR